MIAAMTAGPQASIALIDSFTDDRRSGNAAGLRFRHRHEVGADRRRGFNFGQITAAACWRCCRPRNRDSARARTDLGAVC